MQSGLPPRPVTHRPRYTANILGTAIALLTLVGPLLIINRYAPDRPGTTSSATQRVVQTSVSTKRPQ